MSSLLHLAREIMVLPPGLPRGAQALPQLPRWPLTPAARPTRREPSLLPSLPPHPPNRSLAAPPRIDYPRIKEHARCPEPRSRSRSCCRCSSHRCRRCLRFSAARVLGAWHVIRPPYTRTEGRAPVRVCVCVLVLNQVLLPYDDRQ
jgi:hypothetical protein